MDLILNAPIWLVILLVLVGAAMLISGLRSGQERVRKVSYGLLLVAGLLLIIKWGLPTDEKRVEKKTRQLLSAIGSGDWETVKPLLAHASMFDWEGEQVANETKSAAQTYALKQIIIGSLDVERRPPGMLVRCSVRTIHDNKDYNAVPSTWTFEYQKRGGEWTLIRITPVQIWTFQMGSDLREIIKGAIPYH